MLYNNTCYIKQNRTSHKINQIRKRSSSRVGILEKILPSTKPIKKMTVSQVMMNHSSSSLPLNLRPDICN